MLALALTEPGAPETVEAQLAFHLAAGVDLVLVADGASRPESAHAVHSVPAGSDWDAVAADHGVGWIVEAGAGEFWLPRGGSLADVVGVVPDDVDAIQALERRGGGPWRPRLIRRPGTHSTVLRGWFPVEIVPLEDPRVLEALSLTGGETATFPRRSAVDDPSFGAEVAAWFDEDLRATNALLDELESRAARGLRGHAARLARRARRRGRT